jgi:hypothetical protein
MQLGESREYCQRRGWEVAGEYVDVGISGAKERRPQLDRLLADCGKRQVDAVVVTNVVLMTSATLRPWASVPPAARALPYSLLSCASDSRCDGRRRATGQAVFPRMLWPLNTGPSLGQTERGLDKFYSDPRNMGVCLDTPILTINAKVAGKALPTGLLAGLRDAEQQFGCAESPPLL